MKQIIKKTKNGKTFYEAYRYEKKDIKELKSQLNDWDKLNKKLRGRRINIPESISESIHSALTGSEVVKKYPYKKTFDVIRGKQRVQVKASSNPNSPSSFSPNPNFDKVEHIILNKKGKKWEAKITSFSKKDITTHPNYKRNAPAGKRPRFVLKEEAKKLNKKAKEYRF